MRKTIVLILFLFFTAFITKAQDSIYKNTFKMILLPILNDGIGGVLNLSYERNLSPHSCIELTGRCLVYMKSCGSTSVTGIISAYKYYLISEKKLINSIWSSGYLTLLSEDYHDCSLSYTALHYGPGISLGKRIWFSKKRKSFFDIGVGTTCSFTDYKDYDSIYYNENGDLIPITSKDSEIIWYPRLIFNIGWRF